MKKAIISISLTLVAAAAGAQNIYDALNFCQNNYYGTARTMGLGNAVTAVGGDLGTVGINPAGSAIANYGQFTLTPGVTISSVSTSFSPEGDTRFGPSDSKNKARFTLPNAGVLLRFDTHRDKGLKSVTFSFSSNTTNSFLNGTDAFGLNSSTSKLAELAYSSSRKYDDEGRTVFEGYDPNLLSLYSSFNSTDIPWDVLAGYQGGLFSPYGKDGRNYAGNCEVLTADESYHYIPGELRQDIARNSYGSKSDLLINFGLNISDFIFIGVDLGLPVAKYSFNEYYTESPVSPEQFPMTFIGDKGQKDKTYYRGATSDYSYSARLVGVYGKFGVIVLPFKNFRIGAAIQTPTSFSVTEFWRYSASSGFENPIYNCSCESPEGSYSYNIIAPFSANFGLAYAIPDVGFLSVDYEMTDYSLMRYAEKGAGRRYDDAFADANRAIKETMGLSHYLRAGLEVKINPVFSARAGYNLITSAEKGDSGKRMAYSLGFGYSSPGSFFADMALRLTTMPGTTYGAYFNYDNYNKSGELVNVPSPVVNYTRKLWDVALTFGWRF